VFFQPGLEVEIDALATLNQVVPIKEQLTHYRARSDRLDQLESTLAYRIASRLWRLLRYRK